MSLDLKNPSLTYILLRFTEPRVCPLFIMGSVHLEVPYKKSTFCYKLSHYASSMPMVRVLEKYLCENLL